MTLSAKPRGLDRVWKLLLLGKSRKWTTFWTLFSTILRKHEKQWFYPFSQKCQKPYPILEEKCKIDKTVRIKHQKNDTTMTPQWHQPWPHCDTWTLLDPTGPPWTLPDPTGPYWERVGTCPDPYHGVVLQIDRPPYPTTPGTPPHHWLHVYTLVPRWQAGHGSPGFFRIRGPGQNTNLSKTTIFFNDQNGPVQKWHFLTKSLLNPTLKMQKCHFWRFSRKWRLLTPQLTPLLTPLLTPFLRSQVFPRVLAKSNKYI